MSYGLQTITIRKNVDSVVDDARWMDVRRAVNYSTAMVDIGKATSATLELIGKPVVWVDANSRFEIFLAQDISAVTGSPLDDESPVGIIVGDDRGWGMTEGDSTIGTTAIQVCILFRGPAAVFYDGVDFGAADDADIAAFKVQMAKQGVIASTKAPAITTSLI